jgi:hypothetical protein
MNANSLRIAYGLAVLAAAAGAALDPPPVKGDPQVPQGQIEQYERSAKALAQQYEHGKEQFFKTQKKAGAALTKSFDSTCEQIRSLTRMPAETRTAKVKAIAAEKEAFVSGGRLPQSDEMLRPLLVYQQTLYQSYLPIAQTYEKLFNLYSVKLKDDSRAGKLTADKGEFDQQMRGRTSFRPAGWHGTQFNAGNSIPFFLNIEALEGNSIKAAAVQDRPPGETVFRMEGILSGNRVRLVSTRVVQGGKRTLIFTGFVMENRILAEVVSVATNGKPSRPSIALLNRR